MCSTCLWRKLIVFQFVCAFPVLQEDCVMFHPIDKPSTRHFLHLRMSSIYTYSPCPGKCSSGTFVKSTKKNHQQIIQATRQSTSNTITHQTRRLKTINARSNAKLLFKRVKQIEATIETLSDIFTERIIHQIGRIHLCPRLIHTVLGLFNVSFGYLLSWGGHNLLGFCRTKK